MMNYPSRLTRISFLATALITLALGGVYSTRDQLKQSLYTFLSPNKPLHADVLIIEGWLSECMLKEAATEFLQGNYSYCLVTRETGSHHTPLSTLRNFGIDSSAVKIADADTGEGYNTYYMAVAAYHWLAKNDPAKSTVNVFTAGPHGRKSWVIFTRVFGRNFSVGILSAAIGHCPTGLWWKSKSGTRNLVIYSIGYLYALVWPFATTPKVN